MQQRFQSPTADGQDAPRPVDTPHLTAEEAVQYLRLPSLRALYRAIKEHRLPFGRIGRQYRFHKAHLDRWLEVVGAPVLTGLRPSQSHRRSA